MPSTVVQISVPLKNSGTAYLWWFFLGGLGAHKYYLGRPGWGAIYTFTFGLLGLGALYDLFTMPAQVRAANRKLVSEAEDYYGAGSLTKRVENAGKRSMADYSNADAMISRYLSRQKQTIEPATMAVLSSTPKFGRRK
jgi:TM2 domain-containing membrane protein YozV